MSNIHTDIKNGKLKRNKKKPKARIFLKKTYCSKPGMLLFGGNWGNGPRCAENRQGFELSRGSYEIDPFGNRGWY